MRVALWLALLFVGQLVLGSVASGVEVAQARLDAFGNPLCITGGDHSDSRPDGGKHDLPECCAVGCAMLLGAVASPPDQTPIILRLVPVVARLDAQYRIPPLIAPDHAPGNPRAPPRQA